MAGAAEVDRAALLRRVPLLAGIERVALAKLAAQLDPLRVDAGIELCRQGDAGDRLFIIVSGTCGVYVSEDRGEERLTTLGPGEHFGEIALLTDEPRTATVRTETPADVLQLQRDRFLRLVDSDARIGRTLALSLARRLRTVLRPEDSALRRSSEWLDPSLPIEVLRDAPAATRPRQTLVAGVAFAAGACAAAVPIGDPVARFVLLVAAAIALWLTEPVPRWVTALGLVAAWVALGLATPARALAGFATPTWIFVVSALGLATAVSRSGLLVRAGVLVVERMRPSLGAQALAVMATGVAMIPLLPMRMARVALVTPIALAVADALRLRDRGGASALLGLVAWLGSNCLYFTFLTGSPNVLLTWALLPEASRARFDWFGWLLAALPLGILVAAGTLAALVILLRPETPGRPSREGLRLTLQLLGPMSRRELAVLVILALMVAGWAVGPRIGFDPGIVALAGFIAASAATRADARVIAGLDWDYLVFYGVVLTLAGLARSLGADQVVGGAIGGLLLAGGVGGVALIPVIAIITALARSVLNEDQAVLVLGVALIPLASAMGVEPWTVGVAILAMAPVWHIPAQSSVYLAAHATSEGRLFSHSQARRAAFAYAAVVVVALILVLPYWTSIGVL